MKASTPDNIITKCSVDKLNDLKRHLDLSNEDVISVLNYIKTLKEERNNFSNENLEVLTEREQEVFKLVSSGVKTREIAKILSISHTTVSTHRKKIKRKLNFDGIIDWYNSSSNFLHEKLIS